MKGSILVLDDDKSIGNLVKLTLEKAGYHVKCANTADAAFAVLKAGGVDLMLLDVEMGGLSGFQVLELIKADARMENLPVIMLTVRSEENYKVKGLTTGADDYLVKPFSGKELSARVDALLRRVRRAGTPERVLDCHDIHLDVDKQEVLVRGKPVDLSRTEFNILALIMGRKGYVWTYRALADALSQGTKEMTSEHFYNHFKNLRIKLGPGGKYIETVYGIGYKFSE